MTTFQSGLRCFTVELYVKIDREECQSVERTPHSEFFFVSLSEDDREIPIENAFGTGTSPIQNGYQGRKHLIRNQHPVFLRKVFKTSRVRNFLTFRGDFHPRRFAPGINPLLSNSCQMLCLITSDASTVRSHLSKHWTNEWMMFYGPKKSKVKSQNLFIVGTFLQIT